ncbi:hypothetical protein BMK65_003644 [Shigella flexneri]|nr:hypothetical protein [Shigella flexneri]
MRPSIIFATAEYVKRLREECLRENKPLHRHTRFRRQELAQDEINPDVLAMSGHIARRCSDVNAKIIGRFSPFLMSAIGH